MISVFKKITEVLFALLMAFSLGSTFAFAQTSFLTTGQTPFTINFSPLYPRSGETVDVSLTDYSINFNTAKISWYINGIVFKSGIGLKTLSLVADPTGKITTVRIVVITSDGKTIENTQDINPAGVDLVIEPTGYTHPFYKGKALFVNQGIVRVIVIPEIFENGKRVDTSNLVFNWKENGIVIEKDSGPGKDSIILNGSIPLRDLDVQLEVSDTSGILLNTVSKTITLNNPSILFYENNPLYGILYNQAITSNYNLGGREELIVIAKPYSFNLNSDAGADSSYSWSVDGNPAVLSGPKNQLILKQTSTNVAGSASVSLEVKNLSRIFQFINAGFNVNFGQ